MAAPVTLLNQVSLSEFTDLVEKDFKMNQTMVKPVAGQLFIYDDLSAHTGNTRRYDEVDTETYGNLKREGADATKARVGVGLISAQLKSSLINGENLIARAKATLSKQMANIKTAIGQLQRLSEKTVILTEATV